MNIATEIPVKNVVPNGGASLNGDGEGSVQVHLNDQISVGKAKVFAVYLY